jgi:hypothetical protein
MAGPGCNTTRYMSRRHCKVCLLVAGWSVIIHSLILFLLQLTQTFTSFRSPWWSRLGPLLNEPQRAEGGSLEWRPPLTTARDGFNGRLNHSNGFPSPRRDDRRRDWWRCPTTAAPFPSLSSHTTESHRSDIPLSKIQFTNTAIWKDPGGLLVQFRTHSFVSGVLKCTSSLTDIEEHVSSITKIDWLVLAKIFAVFRDKIRDTYTLWAELWVP